MAEAITTTATTLEGQLVEVAQAIRALEVVAAETLPDFTALSTTALDVDGEEYSFAITMPVDVSSTGGSITFTPEAYL